MARIPAYRQVYTDIKKEIKNGKYPPGSFLPTESEMEKEYQVSRTTIRKAISMLTAEGYLSVKQGRGTEVQEISTSQRLNKITSFTETLTRNGHKVTTQGLSLEVVPAPDFIQKAFGLKDGEMVYHLQRVQCADGRPICIIKNYLTMNMLPGFQLNENDCVSLYTFLEEQYGIVLKDAVEHITACAAPFIDAQILRIPTGAPLLVSTRITNTENGPFEYAILKIVAAGSEEQRIQLCWILRLRRVASAT